MSAPTDPASALDDAVLSQLATDLDPETAARLVAAFVEEMLDRTGRITQAAGDGNARALQHEAHALKSSAATYGACRVSEAARAVEAACRNGDLPAAGRLAHGLPGLAESAAAAFAAWRDGLR